MHPEATPASSPSSEKQTLNRIATWFHAYPVGAFSAIIYPLAIIALEVIPSAVLLALTVPMVICFIFAAFILLALFALLRLTHEIVAFSVRLTPRLVVWSCDLLAQLLSEILLEEAHMSHNQSPNNLFERLSSLGFRFKTSSMLSIAHALEAMSAKNALTRARPHSPPTHITNDELLRTCSLSPSMSQTSDSSTVEGEYDSTSSSSSPRSGTLDLPLTHGSFLPKDSTARVV